MDNGEKKASGAGRGGKLCLLGEDKRANLLILQRAEACPDFEDMRD
jgi:hypothetical protein